MNREIGLSARLGKTGYTISILSKMFWFTKGSRNRFSTLWPAMYGCGYLFVRQLAKWLQPEENITLHSQCWAGLEWKWSPILSKHVSRAAEEVWEEPWRISDWSHLCAVLVLPADVDRLQWSSSLQNQEEGPAWEHWLSFQYSVSCCLW